MNIRIKQSNINWLVLLPVLLMLSIWAGFIIYVDPEVLRSDQFPLITSYEKFVNGDYSWAHLWNAKGGHRFPGYKLLFFLNLHVLGFSPKTEIFLALTAYSIAVVFLVSIFSRSFHGKWKILSILLFLLILFNAQTMRATLYSLIAMRLFDFAGFVAFSAYTFYILDRPEQRGLLKHMLLYIMLGFVVILMFGRGWGMAAIASITGLILLHGVIQVWRTSQVELAKHFGLLAIIMALTFIYLFELSGSSEEGTALEITAFAKYYVVKLGNANVGMISFPAAKNYALDIFIGILYLVISVGFSLSILMKKKLDLQTWMALFLVYFSLAAALLVALSRYDNTGFTSMRHNYELCFGAVGLTYLILLNLSKSKTDELKTIRKLGLGVFIGAFCFGYGANIHGVINNAPKYKKFQDIKEDRFVKIMTRENLTLKNFRKMECRMSVERCTRVLDLIEEHNISRSLR